MKVNSTREQRYLLRKEREEAKRLRRKKRADARFQDMLSLEMERISAGPVKA